MERAFDPFPPTSMIELQPLATFRSLVLGNMRQDWYKWLLLHNIVIILHVWDCSRKNLKVKVSQTIER